MIIYKKKIDKEKNLLITQEESTLNSLISGYHLKINHFLELYMISCNNHDILDKKKIREI